MAARFKELGLTTTNQLLAIASTPEGREMLAVQAQVDPTLIQKLAERANLLRIPGIGDVYAELLERAGVDTLEKLAAARPETLHAALIRVNVSVQLTTRPPTLTRVRKWITQARSLSRAAKYRR